MKIEKFFAHIMQPVLKLKVTFEHECEKLDGQLPPGEEILEARNGYKRTPLCGYTMIFFKQLPSGMYHIVVCDIDEELEKMEKLGFTYEDLKGYDFTF